MHERPSTPILGFRPCGQAEVSFSCGPSHGQQEGLSAASLPEFGVPWGRSCMIGVDSPAPDCNLNCCQGLLLQEKDRFCVCRVGLPALEKNPLQESWHVMQQLALGCVQRGFSFFDGPEG